jgi:hypothetical protein
MFFSFIKATFSWMPTPLYVLVCAVLLIFTIIVVIQILRLIYAVVEFIYKILGGLFGKVVEFFV